MNTLGFLLHRFSEKLGIRNERSCWNSITRESQLLAEAQDLLGRLAWPATEKVERLSGEFWQLRDLEEQQVKLREESAALDQENESAKDQLFLVEESCEEDLARHRARKTELTDKISRLQFETQELVEKDTETKRRFASQKAKLDVLKRQEGNYDAEIERTRTQMAELKVEHEQDLAQITKRETEIKRIEEIVQKVDQDIAARRDVLKAETVELVAEIGRRSKKIAEISAKVGGLENGKQEICFSVGQYLSQHLDGRDPEIRKVLSRFRPLTSRMQSLRRSIQFNQKLARRSGR